jgi:hypothetical protein
MKALVGVVFFVLASVPWWLFRLRPLRVWQRVLAAGALAAVVNTAGILIQVSGGDTGLALAGANGLNVSLLGWHWQNQNRDDIFRRKSLGLDPLLRPKLPFVGRRGMLFMLIYRSRMARDARSQEWIQEKATSRWNFTG